VQIAQARPIKESVNCSVVIDGKTSQHQVNKSEPTSIKSVANNKSTIKWSCDSVIVSDAILSYIPESLEDQL
jgi:hypothetical protein